MQINIISDNRLELAAFNSLQRSNNSDSIDLLSFFRNSLSTGSMMFLIGCQNMRYKGTFRREKSNSKFQSLSMPEFRFFSRLHRIQSRVFFQLNYEPKFCAYTEIGHSQEAYFLKDWVSCEFCFYAVVSVEVLDCQRRNLHYVADV